MTAAVLKPAGTTPEPSEQLMMSVMKGQITGRQVFTRKVGMGSSLQEEDLARDTKLCTWLASSVAKAERPHCRVSAPR